MKYLQFLDELKAFAEDTFAAFQKKLIFTNQNILGVRTPVLRQLAKRYAKEIETFFNFPDEYYEVTFIKLTMVSLLPYEKFVAYLPKCIMLMDNWAVCDSFKAECIKKNKEQFLPVLQSVFEHNTEFAQRYVLVALLADYVSTEYLQTVTLYLQRADCSQYYVHMAAAWLAAELLIKEYAFGVEWLQKRLLPMKTHNKAIQKAIESYRLTREQKEFLRSLKIKT